MEAMDFTRVLFAFGIVVALIFIVGAVAKRLGLHARIAGMQSPEKRMKVIDAMPLDPRRRLVVVKCDKREHLILLGHQHDLVIESYDSKENHA